MLSAIYWDPPRELFTIPLIDRPVAWYGVFFALGFLVGYYLLLHLFQGYLFSKPCFLFKDIKDWPRFLMSLKNKKNHPFLKGFLNTLDSKSKAEIEAWNLNKAVDDKLARALYEKLNQFILAAHDNIEVKLHHPSFPFLDKKLKHLSEKQKRQIAFRLQFEKLFSDSLDGIKLRAKVFVEKVSIYAIVATIIGARLGHILFYEDVIQYLTHPLDILKTWEGGLASHGGAIAIAIAFCIFVKKYKSTWPGVSFLRLVDFAAIPTCFAATLIRVGNFFNQEILGKATNSIFGITFGNPIDGGAVFTRHPAQLYEAFSYLVIFLGLLLLVKKRNALAIEGRVCGLFFMLVFGFRFLIEFIKEEQSIHIFDTLNMGQLLSIPIILAGFLILLFSKRKERAKMSVSLS